MEHGSAGFFAERARFERRVAAITCAVSLAMLAPLLLSYAPFLRDRAERIREDVRFGVRGDRARYVRRILIESAPRRQAALRDLGTVAARPERPGAGERPRSSASRPGRREFRPPVDGAGASLENLLARALARRSDVPVVPPDQLVIEKLVRPDYPEDARERNIEGRISILALVDTLGAVVEVELVNGDGHESLARAAMAAVWQCRFQPYRVAGVVREVYVVMPFNFTIY